MENNEAQITEVTPVTFGRVANSNLIARLESLRLDSRTGREVYSPVLQALTDSGFTLDVCLELLAGGNKIEATRKKHIENASVHIPKQVIACEELALLPAGKYDLLELEDFFKHTYIFRCHLSNADAKIVIERDANSFMSVVKNIARYLSFKEEVIITDRDIEFI